ncbi:MAG: hypothetical protein Q4C13_02555 [Clostridia bacterium]|nr:hypothetical protein [Clostridia bacterium]
MQAVSAIISAGNAAGVVTVDGRILGEAPVHVMLPAEGECYVGLHPERAGFYGVTRRLRFAEGRLRDCPPDVRAYGWRGGLYEIVIDCGVLPAPRPRRFPFTVARCAFEGAQAVLYYEDGLWLSLEKNGRVAAGFPLHEDAEAGELMPAGRALLAAAHGARDSLLMINERYEEAARLEAEDIRLEEGAAVATEPLGLACGYERRTRWRAEAGGLVSEAVETGFFNREPASCAPGLRFLEAMLAGLEDEAAAMLSPALKTGAAEARAFLGAFTLARPHPADPRAAGIAVYAEGVTELRTLLFETEGGQIVNILEES